MILPKPYLIYYRRRAFSLIEVVIAVGIVTFCLVSMVGLLSVCLDLSRESAATTSNTMLFEKVVNQLRVATLNSTEAQQGTKNSSVYPLPSLSTPGDEKVFTVDSQNQYIGDNAMTSIDASKVIQVTVLDPSKLEINALEDPIPLASDGTGGKVSFVRVKIKNAQGYNRDTDKPMSAPSTFCTELNLAIQ